MPGGMTWGMALPEDGLTKNANEFIGILVSEAQAIEQGGRQLTRTSDARRPVLPSRAGAVCPWAAP